VVEIVIEVVEVVVDVVWCSFYARAWAVQREVGLLGPPIPGPVRPLYNLGYEPWSPRLSNQSGTRALVALTE
jgi:hypothetical protein